MLLARILAALADVGTARYPLNERGDKIWNRVIFGIALATALPSLWTTDWHAIAQWRSIFDAIRSYRTDWKSNFFILVAGFVFVLFVWPPLELWNRALKPFDKRANLSVLQRAGAALVYVAVCCLWWAILVWAIYYICSQPNLWR